MNMNSQTIDWKKYYEYIKTMPEPVMPSQLPKVKMRLRDLSAYAEKTGRKVSELSKEEIEQFIER